ncbi:MMPL family transporter [Aestuariirhabdus sp. Z084]|uniref:MMPL family transporter n=1 Tax=Aestuariirhabdus haliotis TaxID=2918751 RepID=UPI00201B375F|nr:MMPL family transporter [Aestuariirhabdus haliotis]MCL6414057.1 MMPL family transporter [Aestuariirhabdus haliotis]MCL6417990.1 MMPL family transporter [Aestuariirhabdus haliotis]
MKITLSPLLNPRWQPARLLIWLLLMLLLVWQGSVLLNTGVKPRTSMLELLPHAEQQPAVQQAVQRFSSQLSRQLLFMVESDSKTSARQAALALEAKLLDSQLLERLQLRIDFNQQQQVGALYYPYRWQLLSRHDRQRLLEQEGSELRETALQNLYNPFSGITAAQFNDDPFGLLGRYLDSIQPPGGQLQLDEDMLVYSAGNRYGILLRATLASDPFDLSTQSRLLATLDKFTSEQGSNVQLLRSGATFYAAAGAESAREEISTIGLGSLCGVMLLILWVFRSFGPLFIAMLSIGSGILAGLICTLLIFGQIHLFTLVIGACLIGVSIDYAFHFFAEQNEGGPHWRPFDGLGRIITAIGMGLISSLLGYSALLATPFPGLQQLAVFSCSGLLVAWLTVVLVYPSLLRPQPSYHNNGLVYLYQPLMRFWATRPAIQHRIVLMMLTVLALIGLLLLHADDDVRQLQPLNPEIQTMDHQLQTYAGNRMDHSYIVLTAATNEALLQTEEALLDQLPSSRSGNAQVRSVGRYVASQKRQRENRALTDQLVEQELHRLLGDAGYTDAAIATTAASIAQQSPIKALDIDSLNNGPLREQLNHLWIDNGQYGVASVLLFTPELHQTMKTLAAQITNAQFVSQADDTSDILARYRYRISLLLIAAYGAILLLLRMRYPLTQALKVITVPVLASSLALGINGLMGQPINLFHLLALLLVLGISIDYSVFFAERGHDWRTTLLGVTLAAITTLLSFGLLSLSDTPAISAFGQTLLVGILVAYLLAPFAMPRQTGAER